MVKIILNGTEEGLKRLKKIPLNELSKELGVKVTSIDKLKGLKNNGTNKNS